MANTETRGSQWREGKEGGRCLVDWGEGGVEQRFGKLRMINGLGKWWKIDMWDGGLSLPQGMRSLVSVLAAGGKVG